MIESFKEIEFGEKLTPPTPDLMGK